MDARLLLLPLLATAGCIADAPVWTSTAESDEARGCVVEDKVIFAWEPPAELQRGFDAAESFEVAAGTLELAVDWTPPAAHAGRYGLALADPAGKPIYQLDGRTAGVMSTSMTIAANVQDRHQFTQPPAAGRYDFAFHADGIVRGGQLTVTASGCA